MPNKLQRVTSKSKEGKGQHQRFPRSVEIPDFHPDARKNYDIENDMNWVHKSKKKKEIGGDQCLLQIFVKQRLDPRQS